MRQRTVDIIISCSILAICILLLLLIPHQVGDLLTQDRVGMVSFPPWAFPAISLLVIVLLSGGWLIRTCTSKEQRLDEINFPCERSDIKRIIRAIITLLILILTAFSLNTVGFIPSVGILTAVTLIYFGVKDWKTILVLSVVLTLFIYFFFQVGLDVLFPEGILSDMIRGI